VVAEVAHTDLFSPVQLGAYLLANRIVMAPLTRCRASAEGVPTALMSEYYAQRASAGLIVTEGVNVCAQGRGFANTPGIYQPAQVEGWQGVAEAIHLKGGRAFMQLWHVGRVSHPSLQPGGDLPVAPSAICAQTRVHTPMGLRACVTPRVMTREEIPTLVDHYRQAANNALAAGLDGVEIHAANGYLLEQFLRDSSNRRTDEYGGSREKRARLLLEVTEAVVEACGAGRVGVRLSPLSPVNDLALDRDPEGTYSYVVERLNAYPLAYIHVIEGITQGARWMPGGFDLQVLRRLFQGTYIANNGYDRALALEARRGNRADLIAFGRAFIGNPDLVERLRLDGPLVVADQTTFFSGGAHGYTDYPSLSAATQNAGSSA